MPCCTRGFKGRERVSGRKEGGMWLHTLLCFLASPPPPPPRGLVLFCVPAPPLPVQGLFLNQQFGALQPQRARTVTVLLPAMSPLLGRVHGTQEISVAVGRGSDLLLTAYHERGSMRSLF